MRPTALRLSAPTLRRAGAATFVALSMASAPRRATPGDIVLIANKQANTLTLADIASGEILATLPTGAGPHEVAASHDGRRAVVSNYGAAGQPGSSLTVVDIPGRTVVRTIDLGEYRRPHGSAFLPGDEKLAVTVEANQAVLIVDLERGVVESAVPTTQNTSHMFALRADGTRGFTSNIGSGSITEIDVPGRTHGRVLPVAPRTEGIAVTPDGSHVWVGSNDLGKVFVVDVATWVIVDTLDAPGTPYRIAITPDGARALVTTPMANTVRVFDAKTREPRGTIAMPENAQPVGVAIAPDSKLAFVACQGIQQVLQVDLATLRVVRTYPTGAGPDGIAVARGAAVR